MRMYMRKVIVLFVLSLFIFQPSFAGEKNKYYNSYSFSHAIELMKEGKNNEAIPYLKSEIDEHKKNGYAYSLLGHVYALNGEYGEALTNINLSLKYLSKNDEFYSFSLKNRAIIYSKLGDEKNALADYTLRVKLFKKTEDVYCERAQFYIDMNNYEAALKDFESAIRLNPGNAVNFAGKAICFRNMNMIEQAIICCDYAVKLDPEYSLGYSQRGHCHRLMKNYLDAADDYVKSLDIDGNNAAYYGMLIVSDSAFTIMDMKLKMMQISQPENSYWPYCRAIIYERAGKYKNAIELYERSNNISFNPISSQRMAYCKENLGDYPGALKAFNDALSADSSNIDYLQGKAECLHNLGMKSDCYKTIDHAIELDPKSAYSFYLKGWYEKCNGDVDMAIEDLSMSIMLYPEYINALSARGILYQRKGMKNEAEADFRKILEIDTVEGYYLQAHYAYSYLGNKEKALACMQSVIKNDSINNFYDAACLYSLAKDEKMALHYLRRALETGFRKFHHIEQDTDLDFIRNTSDFKNMIDEYKSKVAEYYDK